jgi:RNA-splicing ligase RtcB
MFKIVGKYSIANVMIDDIESSCYSQINNFVNHLAFKNNIAIMPDTHAGKGSVIGFTMPMTDKIIPNVIGVDIGCGMLSVNIGRAIGISLEDLDNNIRGLVPFGTAIHNGSNIKMDKEFPWKKIQRLAEDFNVSYYKRFNIKSNVPEYNLNWFSNKIMMIDGNYNRIINSLGTLGSGNHFIEIGIDLNNDYWITIHTGSRNLGKRICEYWQDKAEHILRHDIKICIEDKIREIRLKYSGREIPNKIRELRESYGLTDGLNNKGLEWLEGCDAINYFYDMIFCQVYAEVNREYIMRTILKILGKDVFDRIETVHNFIDFRDFIIRKGAIRSYAKEKMIIPFNMRDGILICEGKSNLEWNCSAPHGAGRILSRSQAKKQLLMETFKHQMKDIYSTSVVESTLDEAPDAYKSSSLIEELIKPTAIVLNRIKPVLNMKDR